MNTAWSLEFNLILFFKNEARMKFQAHPLSRLILYTSRQIGSVALVAKSEVNHRSPNIHIFIIPIQRPENKHPYESQFVIVD